MFNQCRFFNVSNFQDGSKAKIIEILEKDQQMIAQIIQFLMTHQNNEVKIFHLSFTICSFIKELHATIFGLYKVTKKDRSFEHQSFVIGSASHLVCSVIFIKEMTMVCSGELNYYKCQYNVFSIAG